VIDYFSVRRSTGARKRVDTDDCRGAQFEVWTPLTFIGRQFLRAAAEVGARDAGRLDPDGAESAGMLENPRLQGSARGRPQTRRYYVEDMVRKHEDAEGRGRLHAIPGDLARYGSTSANRSMRISRCGRAGDNANNS